MYVIAGIKNKRTKYIICIDENKTVCWDNPLIRPNNMKIFKTVKSAEKFLYNMLNKTRYKINNKNIDLSNITIEGINLIPVVNYDFSE